jgi:hypothetical protein
MRVCGFEFIVLLAKSSQKCNQKQFCAILSYSKKIEKRE